MADHILKKIYVPRPFVSLSSVTSDESSDMTDDRQSKNLRTYTTISYIQQTLRVWMTLPLRNNDPNFIINWRLPILFQPGLTIVNFITSLAVDEIINGFPYGPDMQKWYKKIKFCFQEYKVPPRYNTMPTDQDWTAVWPAAHSFKWATVPFPVRQGSVRVSTSM